LAQTCHTPFATLDAAGSGRKTPGGWGFQRGALAAPNRTSSLPGMAVHEVLIWSDYI